MRKNIGIFLVCMMLVTLLLVIFPVENVKAAGNTLYVGGNGSGNYTTIQSAIDAASSGDTIFVYSGTYYENIIIDKSITITGEDRESVIIDGGGIGRVVSIKANDVTICGFTLQNSGNTWYHDAGVGFGTFSSTIINHITIRDNKMINNYDGIYAYYGDNHIISGNILTNNRHCGIFMHSGCKKTIVTGNTANYNDDCGIYCQHIEEDEIFDNTVTNNLYGIYILDSISDIFHNNIVKDNNIGFIVSDSYEDKIYRNQIENNDLGLYYDLARYLKIYENNYVNNDNHATFDYPILLGLTIKPTWRNNYWQGQFWVFPKIINGNKYFEFINPFNPYEPIIFEFPSFEIDFNPAREPFQI